MTRRTLPILLLSASATFFLGCERGSKTPEETGGGGETAAPAGETAGETGEPAGETGEPAGETGDG